MSQYLITSIPFQNFQNPYSCQIFKHFQIKTFKPIMLKADKKITTVVPDRYEYE